MAHRYILTLMQQYSKATGKPETVLYDRDFLKWVGEYKILLQQLKNYYKGLGIILDSPNVIETDKGLSDTLTTSPSYRISHYDDPYSYIDIYNGKPVMTNSPEPISGRKMYDISGRDLIHTFNPYKWSDLFIYPELSNIGQPYAIAMVGKKKDFDRDLKIAYLNEIKKYLTNYREEKIEVQDTFINCIISNNYRNNYKEPAPQQNSSKSNGGGTVFRPK